MDRSMGVALLGSSPVCGDPGRRSCPGAVIPDRDSAAVLEKRYFNQICETGTHHSRAANRTDEIIGARIAICNCAPDAREVCYVNTAAVSRLPVSLPDDNYRVPS